jgi:hypothetical protein
LSWLTVAEVSDLTKIADPTLRRYLKDYADFIKTSKDGHITTIAEESVSILEKIREYSFEKRWGKERIKRELQANYPMTYIIGQDTENNEITVGETLEEMRRMSLYMKKLVDENQMLRHEMKELRNDFEALLTSQDKHNKNSIEILKEMREDMRRRDEKSSTWFPWLRKKRDDTK